MMGIMWTFQYLRRIDPKSFITVLILMGISLVILSSYSVAPTGLDLTEEPFFTPIVWSQIKRFALGFGVYFFCAAFDYNKLREWTWLLYCGMLVTLVGVFFTDAVAGVHRWYKVPLIGVGFQPSEYSKLIVVLALAWFLERTKERSHLLRTAIEGGIIVLIPFALILKQPDLGTALVLYPVTIVMFYFGGLHPWVVRSMSALAIMGLSIVLTIFLGIVDHEEAKPFATKFLKNYQYDRLDPNTHHQKAAVTAIAIGGVTGAGWRKGTYTNGGWLPMPVTDSVFPAFGEEFGLLGLLALISLFYTLVYLGFQVITVAKDSFGRLLAAGVSTYLAIHVLVNIGMMCGLLPITGVPLTLVTYGGSAVFSSMAALGILQSIYSRRFMF